MSKKENRKDKEEELSAEELIAQMPQHSIIEVLKDPEATKGLENLIVNVFKNYSKNATGHRFFLGFCFMAIVISVTVLSFNDAMTPSAGVILGALAGYLFGSND